MISAEEARKMTNKEDKFRLRKLKIINEAIERKIKDAARRGNFSVDFFVLEGYKKDVISSLKKAGYKVRIKDYTSEWSGDYFEIMISW